MLHTSLSHFLYLFPDQPNCHIQTPEGRQRIQLCNQNSKLYVPLQDSSSTIVEVCELRTHLSCHVLIHLSHFLSERSRNQVVSDTTHKADLSIFFLGVAKYNFSSRMLDVCMKLLSDRKRNR